MSKIFFFLERNSQFSILVIDQDDLKLLVAKGSELLTTVYQSTNNERIQEAIEESKEREKNSDGFDLLKKKRMKNRK